MSSAGLLILEDNLDLAAGLIEMFGEVMGFDVHHSASGEEAVEAILKKSLDLGLFDINLPDINGIEVLRQIRHRGVGLEVLFVTGFRLGQVVGEALPGYRFYTRRVDQIQDALLAEEQSLDEQLHFAIFSDQKAYQHELSVFEKRSGFLIVDALDYGVADVAANQSGLVYAGNACFAEMLAHALHCVRAGFQGPVIMLYLLPDNYSGVDPFTNFDITGCILKPFEPVELVEKVMSRIGN